MLDGPPEHAQPQMDNEKSRGLRCPAYEAATSGSRGPMYLIKGMIGREVRQRLTATAGSHSTKAYGY